MSRIRTNLITNRMANGAPTVSNGLVISGVTTTSEIFVGNNIKLDPISGIATATSFRGDGSQLTGIDATKIETGNTKVETIDTGSDGHIKITTEGNERLRIISGGNVGIGTDNPQSILDINKDVSGGLNEVNIRNHHATGGAVLRLKTQGTYASPTYQAMLGASDSGGTIRVGAVSNHPLVFLTNNAERFQITSAGHLRPAANATYDLGESGAAWRNLYVNDAHFSNEGHSNSVDGTWGSWTLQEGENDIFMINNRTGKKYAITMKEVE